MTGNLSASALLTVWEQGVAATPLERALLILRAAHPGESRDDLAHLSIGERDHRLLLLREQTFGPVLQALCDCPRCHEPVEMALRVADFVSAAPTAPDESLHCQLDGYTIRFRLPASVDLAAVASINDQDLAARQLLERCLMETKLGETQILPGHLPKKVADAAADRIARADCQSDIELDIVCPVCGHAWTSRLDIAVFFWLELSAHAERLLRDVHTLAQAYGWSEEAILNLSYARRQAYLEMAGG